MTKGRWHLWGTVVEGAGYSVKVMFGNDDADPWEPEPTIKTTDILSKGPEITLPLLGSWEWRPTIAQQNAVLAPGMEPDSQADDQDEYGDDRVDQL